jgi:arsenite-transporting ATPase
MRLILYLGKGGVGKTTLAAATAARAAQLGKRTLVVSTDLAHSLADALETPLSAEPREVAPRLFAQEINVLDEVRAHWGRMQDYVTNVLKKQGVNEVAAEEMALIPGMDEIVALLHIYRQAQAATFDVVVVDAAPTGETVRLLSMPETFLVYANRLKGWRNLALSAAKPLLRQFLPGVDVLESLEAFNEQVDALRGVLTNPDISSYRLVVTPEKMVVKEALRAETYLALYDYPIDGVLCNRVLPLPASGRSTDYQDVLLRDMVEQQRGYYDLIHTTFEPLPVWDAPYRSREVLGAPALAALGAEVWGESDPTQVFYRGNPQQVIKRGDRYILRLPLPHVELSKVQMTKKGDELIIEIGNFKRDIALPHVLAPLEASAARMVGGALEVTFEPASGERSA